MSKKKIVVASANAHKLTEIAEILTEYEVLSMKDAGFTAIEVYADRLFEAPREGEQRIYIKARKGRVIRR